MRPIFCLLLLSLWTMAALADDADVLGKLLSQDPTVDVSSAFKMWNHYDSKKRLRAREYDLNGDGNPDLFEEFNEKGRLTLRKQDRNFDGKIDEITKFVGEKVIKETDTKFSGHFDRIEEQVWDGDTLAVHIKVDRQGAGKFEEETVQSFPPQQGDHAGQDVVNRMIDSTSKPEKLTRRSDGFWQTSYRFRINNLCTSKLKDINKTLHDALADGLNCLDKLGTDATKKNIALTASLLALDNPPPTLACYYDADFQREKFGAGDGYGSVPGVKNHPFIALNLTNVEKMPTPEMVKETIFKELFHNMNYVHGRDMEFGEACSWLCFAPKILSDGPVTKRLLELAGRICRGEYKEGISDPKYLDDFVEFAQFIEKPFYPIYTLKQLLREKPDDHDLHMRFLKAHLGPEELPGRLPFALAWAKIIRRYDSPLSASDKKILDGLDEQEKKSPIIKALAKQMEPLAEAYDLLFHNKMSKLIDALDPVTRIDANSLPPVLPADLRNQFAISSNNSIKVLVQDLVKFYQEKAKTMGNMEQDPVKTKAARAKAQEIVNILKETYYVPALTLTASAPEGAPAGQ